MTFVPAGVHGKIADAVARRGGDGVITVRHHVQGAIANEAGVIAADQTFEGCAKAETVFRSGAVVVHLLLEEIFRNLLVFMRRIRGPAAVRDGDFGEP